MIRGVLKNLLLLSVVVLLASGCAGKKKRGGGPGGGDGLPKDGGGGAQNGGNQQGERDRQEIQKLVDQRDEVQRQLDEALSNKNNPFVQNGIANTNVSPDQFVLPGGINAPGVDRNIISGNALDGGARAVPLDPNGQPQVIEAGVNPLIPVGNPNTASLRSSAQRQQPPTRGLASHN